MKTQKILQQLRTSRGLSQDALAEKLHVTRQAVSRWETGATLPGIDTLRQLSDFFGVSIHTLLGEPFRLVCQCCGMPMEEDSVLSREPDGAINEAYCKWCYADGQFTYSTMEQLLDYLLAHMPDPEHLPPQERRAQFAQYLSQLRHWR